MEAITELLYLNANTVDRNELDLEGEYAEIQRSLSESEFGNRLHLNPWGDAGAEEFFYAASEMQPQILHFSGHGDPCAALVFRDPETGGDATEDARTVGRVFESLWETIPMRLVFLNSCYSEDQAEAISKFVDFAVGMEDTVPDTAAKDFSAYFYRCLAEGLSCQQAFARADREVAKDQRDWVKPHRFWQPYAKPQDRFLIGLDARDSPTVQTVDITPPEYLVEGDHPIRSDECQFGVLMVADGRARDDQDLRNQARPFIRKDGFLRTALIYQGSLGVQFKCFVDVNLPGPLNEELEQEIFRSGQLAQEAGRVASWEPVIDRRTGTVRISFLLPGYATETTPTGFENNYLEDTPPIAVLPDEMDRVPRANRAPVLHAARGPALGAVRAPLFARSPVSAPLVSDTGGLITTDVDRFIDHLSPGDVLLFDSLSPVSQLIQFFENRPVNHSALFLGDGQFAQVTRHTATTSATQRKELATHLAADPGPYDRTVTALRHNVVCDGRATGAPVVERAEAYLDGTNHYSHLSVFTLAVPCFLRSYGAQIEQRRLRKGKKGPSWLLRLLGRFSNTLLDEFDEGADPAGEGIEPGRHTLTCSEFVYRCFAEVGNEMGLRISNPVTTWSTDRRTRDGRPRLRRSEQAGLGVAYGGVLLDFNSAITGLWEADRGGDDESEEDRAIRGGYQQVMAGWWRDSGEVFIESNRNLSKYGPDGGFDATVRGKVMPDHVTPRDLWSSPSLRAVAVLHHPASATDRDLDALRDFSAGVL